MIAQMSGVVRSMCFTFGWTKNKKWWALADPQIVVDHENDKEFGLIELEYGRIMFGGLSSYLRPSIGIGSDKPDDWSMEFGFKVIWT